MLASNEKRISIETPLSLTEAQAANGDANTTKVEYRVWNPFRSKLAAGILGGLDMIFMKPGAKVLYLGAASGTSVSHVSDIVGPEGRVYAVEFSHRSGRDLIGLATKRTNIIPIIEDARHPQKYRMLVGMVDVIFADVAQPDQARIVSYISFIQYKSTFTDTTSTGWYQCSHVSQARWRCLSLHQGQLYRFYQTRRTSLLHGSK